MKRFAQLLCVGTLLFTSLLASNSNTNTPSSSDYVLSQENQLELLAVVSSIIAPLPQNVIQDTTAFSQIAPELNPPNHAPVHIQAHDVPRYKSSAQRPVNKVIQVHNAFMNDLNIPKHWKFANNTTTTNIGLNLFQGIRLAVTVESSALKTSSYMTIRRFEGIRERVREVENKGDRSPEIIVYVLTGSKQDNVYFLCRTIYEHLPALYDATVDTLKAERDRATDPDWYLKRVLPPKSTVTTDGNNSGSSASVNNSNSRPYYTFTSNTLAMQNQVTSMTPPVFLNQAIPPLQTIQPPPVFITPSVPIQPQPVLSFVPANEPTINTTFLVPIQPQAVLSFVPANEPTINTANQVIETAAVVPSVPEQDEEVEMNMRSDIVGHDQIGEREAFVDWFNEYVKCYNLTEEWQLSVAESSIQDVYNNLFDLIRLACTVDETKLVPSRLMTVEQFREIKRRVAARGNMGDKSARDILNCLTGPTVKNDNLVDQIYNMLTELMNATYDALHEPVQNEPNGPSLDDLKTAIIGLHNRYVEALNMPNNLRVGTRSKWSTIAKAILTMISSLANSGHLQSMTAQYVAGLRERAALVSERYSSDAIAFVLSGIRIADKRQRFIQIYERYGELLRAAERYLDERAAAHVDDIMDTRVGILESAPTAVTEVDCSTTEEEEYQERDENTSAPSITENNNAVQPEQNNSAVQPEQNNNAVQPEQNNNTVLPENEVIDVDNCNRPIVNVLADDENDVLSGFVSSDDDDDNNHGEDLYASMIHTIRSVQSAVPGINNIPPALDLNNLW